MADGVAVAGRKVRAIEARWKKIDDISMLVISSILSWKNGIINTVNNGFNPREELI